MIGVILVLLVFLPFLCGLILATTTGALPDDEPLDDEPTSIRGVVDAGRAAWGHARRARED